MFIATMVHLPWNMEVRIHEKSPLMQFYLAQAFFYTALKETLPYTLAAFSLRHRHHSAQQVRGYAAHTYPLLRQRAAGQQNN